MAHEDLPPNRLALPGFGLPIDFEPSPGWTELRGAPDTERFQLQDAVNYPGLGDGVNLFPSALSNYLEGEMNDTSPL
jgi:hypothetical protein